MAGPLLTVAHTQRGLEDLARAARARSHAKILAVTGSAGKTTTKEILRYALQCAGPYPCLGRVLQQSLGRAVVAGGACRRTSEYGVFEIGMNHFGEIRNLVSFVRPHVALITTIAPAHLEFFGSCEAIADAKSEIFEGLMPGGLALIPSDSPYADRLEARAAQAQGLPGGPVRQKRRGETAVLYSRWRRHAGQVRHSGPAVDCLVGAPGLHIAENVVGALAAVALLDGDVLNAAAG